MSQLPSREAERLGQRLQLEGYLPLPDVNDDGVLIGTILWRQHGPHVEYLALRTNGFALAMRAEASFSYRTPHLHGPVLGHQIGSARDALGWMLGTAASGIPRRPQGQHHRYDHEWDDR